LSGGCHLPADTPDTDRLKSDDQEVWNLVGDGRTGLIAHEDPVRTPIARVGPPHRWPSSLATVNVSEFYAEDVRRRESVEVAFGLEWRVDTDPTVLYSVHWIVDTREIYILREPQPPRPMGFDPRLGRSFLLPLKKDALRVEVLGWAENRQAIEVALDGWQGQMDGPNSLQWVRDRLEEAAQATQETGSHGATDPGGQC